MEVNESHSHLIKEVQAHLYPWRKRTIGIDGHDGVGKSGLARYIAWELDLPAIETDLLIVRNAKPPAYRYDDLARLIDARHALNRPVIVEGVFLLHTLCKINVACDFLIYVENEEDNSSLALGDSLEVYDKEFNTKGKANHVFTWRIDR
ncbi:MAG: hypothetical protein FD165_2485 [Gammaproteobacteria bacterium]|nr:MAG: hypothetical protein FD165_2485 [Gammaproteobacteria bacterium]TND02928.1 MAG: hypothetical protein FD120_1997 [Gammaproteobacteria bacterium]